MKLLRSLNPKWIGILRPDSGEGIEFDCPVCEKPHRIVAYFSNPLDGGEKAYSERQWWTRKGTNFAQLSIEPSIDYGKDCFHGWVESGRVFNVDEAILTVMMRHPKTGSVGPVALSPTQALWVARDAIKRAKKALE